MTKHKRGKQFLLWVDAVGGYLVCLGDKIVIGQPSPQSEVDVPILADLSSRHAIISRDGGAYVFEALHTSKVDDRIVEGLAVLLDGQIITLGESVRLRFRKPHVLSTTARLDIETNHKTQPSVDGIILLAESCVLGPKSHSHIPCRDWQEDVVLFRQHNQLICRASSQFQIDGIDVGEQGRIAAGSHVEGREFSFTLEAVE